MGRANHGMRALKPERERRRAQLAELFQVHAELSPHEVADALGCWRTSAHSLMCGLERDGFLVSVIHRPIGGGRKRRYFRMTTTDNGGREDGARQRGSENDHPRSAMQAHR